MSADFVRALEATLDLGRAERMPSQLGLNLNRAAADLDGWEPRSAEEGRDKAEALAGWMAFLAKLRSAADGAARREAVAFAEEFVSRTVCPRCARVVYDGETHECPGERL